MKERHVKKTKLASRVLALWKWNNYVMYYAHLESIYTQCITGYNARRVQTHGRALATIHVYPAR